MRLILKLYQGLEFHQSNLCTSIDSSAGWATLLRYKLFVSVSLHRLHLEASVTKNTDNIGAIGSEIDINENALIQSAMRAVGNSKTLIDGFDRALFSSTCAVTIV